MILGLDTRNKKIEVCTGRIDSWQWATVNFAYWLSTLYEAILLFEIWCLEFYIGLIFHFKRILSSIKKICNVDDILLHPVYDLEISLHQSSMIFFQVCKIFFVLS